MSYNKTDYNELLDRESDTETNLVLSAVIMLIFVGLLIGNVMQYQETIRQQNEIIELQKDAKRWKLSTDYRRLKIGVESGEQFPVVNGDWYKCVKVDTE